MQNKFLFRKAGQRQMTVILAVKPTSVGRRFLSRVFKFGPLCGIKTAVCVRFDTVLIILSVPFLSVCIVGTFCCIQNFFLLFYKFLDSSHPWLQLCFCADRKDGITIVMEKVNQGQIGCCAGYSW